MKLIIVKQENGKYLFRVPEMISIGAGEQLVLDTAKGATTGMALCDAFYASEADSLAVMKAFSTEPKRMKYVIGKVRYDYFPLCGEGMT